MAGVKHTLGPGRIEGDWYILRNSTPTMLGKLGYRVVVYVDNGYGVSGNVPVQGSIYYGHNHADLDALEQAVIEDADYAIDSMIFSSAIETYLPHYLEVE